MKKIQFYFETEGTSLEVVVTNAVAAGLDFSLALLEFQDTNGEFYKIYTSKVRYVHGLDYQEE